PGRDDPTALWCAGYVLAFLAFDLDAAMLLIERACALNPNSAMAWNRAGYVKAYLGDYATSIENFERAIRLSPVDPLLYLSQIGLAMSYTLVGRYDDAVRWAERAVSEQPNYPVSLRVLAAALALSGRLDEARRVTSELLRVAPPTRLSNVAHIASKLFRRTE